MAILKDINFEYSKTSLIFKLEVSKYFDQNVKWIDHGVTFDFSEEWPALSVEGQGDDDFSGTKSLVEGIKKLAKCEITEIDHYPMDPDYHLVIKYIGFDKYKKENIYDVFCAFDACGAGPAITLSINGKDLRKFADELEKELQIIENKCEHRNIK